MVPPYFLLPRQSWKRFPGHRLIPLFSHSNHLKWKFWGFDCSNNGWEKIFHKELSLANFSADAFFARHLKTFQLKTFPIQPVFVSMTIMTFKNIVLRVTHYFYGDGCRDFLTIKLFMVLREGKWMFYETELNILSSPCNKIPMFDTFEREKEREKYFKKLLSLLHNDHHHPTHSLRTPLKGDFQWKFTMR